MFFARTYQYLNKAAIVNSCMTHMHIIDEHMAEISTINKAESQTVFQVKSRSKKIEIIY